MSLADVSLLAYTRLAHEGGFHLDGYAAVRRWIGETEKSLGLPPARLKFLLGNGNSWPRNVLDHDPLCTSRDDVGTIVAYVWRSLTIRSAAALANIAKRISPFGLLNARQTNSAIGNFP